jgi:class 3 adenylate cyclase
MTLQFETMSLTEIIRLQNRLSSVLKERFERTLALGFSDVVGSTAYFQRFGDEGGRRQQQRHLDLLQEALRPSEGRIVDTAGDGAFVCFPRAPAAVEMFERFQKLLTEDNASLSRELQLATRTGIHWGPVLSDGALVAGEAANLCARLTATANPGEIRLTRAVLMELSAAERLRCRPLAPITLNGIAEPVEILVFEWKDADPIPTEVRIEETGVCIPLPNRDSITFGRLRETSGVPGNDIVLAPADARFVRRISRWHFELHRKRNGLALRLLSDQPTEVDDVLLHRGDEVPIRRGTVVRIARVLTLTFLPLDSGRDAADETKAESPEP